jgi:hypothetical protein
VDSLYNLLNRGRKIKQERPINPLHLLPFLLLPLGCLLILLPGLDLLHLLP